MSKDAQAMLQQKTQEQATTRQITRQSDLVNVFSLYANSIDESLPAAATDLNAQRIIQIAATVMGSSPDLMRAASLKPATAVAAVMQAAILGLNPLPQMAECFFIPFKGEVSFQIGYKGLMNLYHRCPIVKDVFAHVVCSGDEFEWALGLHPTLTHRPMVSPRPDGSNITHVYGVAHYVNGGEVFVVLTKSDVDALAIRGGGKGPAWKTDYAAMAQAKALKQLKRFIPMDSSIAAAIATDGQALEPTGFRDGIYEYPLSIIDTETVEEETTETTVDTETGEMFGNGQTKIQPHPATE